MTSWLVDWFITSKVEVTLDEARRYRRTHLCLTDHEIKSLDNKTMRRIYNSKITHLLLNKNSLTLAGFPRDFGFFGQNLISLTLAGNKLTEIPASIGLLKSLKVLNVSCNPLAQELPAALSELKSLRKLYAHHTNIGIIPEEVSQMKELKVLGLRHNRIQSIPPVVLKLPKLQRLTLSNNRIREIPLELVEARALIHFNLNFNRVSVLPANIWDQMQNLRYLFLKSNCLVLSALMVQDMQKMPKLQMIDLSYNVLQNQTDLQVIVTPGTNYPGEVEVKGDVETDENDILEIWRRAGGLSTESSHHAGFLVESTSVQWKLKSEMNTSSQVLKEKPQRHSSEPTKTLPREISLTKRGESGGNAYPAGTENPQEANAVQFIQTLKNSTSQPSSLAVVATVPSKLDNKGLERGSEALDSTKTSISGIPKRIVMDLTRQISMPKSNNEIPEFLPTDHQPQLEVDLEFERAIDTDATEGQQEKFCENQDMLPPLGVVEEIEPGDNEEEQEEAGNMDDEDSQWEDSVATNDLDQCDVDSDLSEYEEMPFDRTEAHYTLYSVLF